MLNILPELWEMHSRHFVFLWTQARFRVYNIIHSMGRMGHEFLQADSLI